MPSGSIAHPPEHELRKLVDEAVMEECRLGSRGLWLCVDRVEQVGQPRERLKVWATLHFLQAGSPFCCGEPECQLGLIERGEPIAERIRRALQIEGPFKVDFGDRVDVKYHDGVGFAHDLKT